MKIIGRILIILAAALVIVGATLAITNSGSSAQYAASAAGGQAFRPGGDPLSNVDLGEALVPGQRPEGFDGGSRPDHDEIGGGSFISAQLIKNLAIIAGFVLVVTLLDRFLKIRRPRRALKDPAS